MADFSLEDEYDGPVCGIDEVGRGPLAGPVVAACVYIPPVVRSMAFVNDIRDSKKLSFRKLEALYSEITQHCLYGVARIEPEEIDRINILQASLKAMEEAYKNTQSPCSSFQLALIDGNKIPAHLPCSARAVVKGDSLSKSIAAASIVAKYTRDKIMHTLAQEHPYYGWESNVGYPAKAHLDGIDAHGITPHHRKSYAPVKNFIAYGATRKGRADAA
ncbi:MAG: ribonuclease HII [Alphaproteobacteria bacterium]|nr:ribonuclease HII [Alphaproteobacteria bacterium]